MKSTTASMKPRKPPSKFPIECTALRYRFNPINGLSVEKRRMRCLDWRLTNPITTYDHSSSRRSTRSENDNPTSSRCSFRSVGALSETRNLTQDYVLLPWFFMFVFDLTCSIKISMFFNTQLQHLYTANLTRFHLSFQAVRRLISTLIHNPYIASDRYQHHRLPRIQDDLNICPRQH
jgi:hypothetical protein